MNMTRAGDSYCGIYCEACSVLRHGKTGDADGFVAALNGVPAEEIACGGCTSDRVYAGCRTCAIRDCARVKGVDHCSSCGEYPCGVYRSWQRAGRILPHVLEAAGSMKTIRRDGGDAWLAEQEKRWSCPECGAPFSWYAANCASCGRSLTSRAYAMTGARRLLCRIILPLAYRKGKGERLGD